VFLCVCVCVDAKVLAIIINHFGEIQRQGNACGILFILMHNLTLLQNVLHTLLGDNLHHGGSFVF